VRLRGRRDMRYLLWPLLRAASLLFGAIITVSAWLKAILRGVTGWSCLLQLILMPAFALTAMIYHTARRLYLEIAVLDVKLGFAQPEKGLRLAEQTFPGDPFGYWYRRLYDADRGRRKYG
jgi:hypothetical protein